MSKKLKSSEILLTITTRRPVIEVAKYTQSIYVQDHPIFGKMPEKELQDVIRALNYGHWHKHLDAFKQLLTDWDHTEANQEDESDPMHAEMDVGNSPRLKCTTFAAFTPEQCGAMTYKGEVISWVEDKE